VAKKLIAVRVKEAHLAELERIGKREDDSVSELIRKAIEDYLKRMRKK
jgi:metal-responsive CopG/Arc/MetJ family transcriptional regulator